MTVLNKTSKFDDAGTVLYEDDTRIVTQYTTDDLAKVMNGPMLVKAKAIIARINRKLRRDYRQLHVCRPGSTCSDQTGRYYVLDHEFNLLIRPHVDLHALASELGVLRDDEQIIDD